jgi:hypothetical protein
MKQNIHQLAIPLEDREKINEKIKEIREIIDKFARPLTTQDRREMLIMGNKTAAFVEKSFELAKGNPNLCPNFFDISEFAIDVEDAIGLRVMRNNISQVFEMVDDIVLLSGSEAYQSALTFYNYVKFLASEDIPYAKTVYDELKKQFPGKKRKKKNDNTDES